MKCFPFRVIVSTVLFVLICVVTQSASALEPAEIYERWRDAVVTVVGPEGLGSGFVIPPTGNVVTSLHVVKGQDRLQVILRGGERRVISSVRVRDEERDLAIMSIDPTGLPQVVLGDSATVRPGDRVVAIGTPEGLGHTVTEGIISQIRTIGGITILQTQTPISQGSSGGPLFNKDGEVIGINFASWRSGQNLNFAVAVNELRALIGEPSSGAPRIPPFAPSQPQPGRAGRPVRIPETVQGKWQAVRLRVEQKMGGKAAQVYTVALGGRLDIPGSQLRVHVGDFLPALQVSGNELTSASNEPTNPAVLVTVTEGGKESFRGWLFSKFSDMQPFEHPKYRITLVEGVPRR